MSYVIDKSVARDWVRVLNRMNETFVEELAYDTLSLVDFAERFTAHLFANLRSIGDADPASQTEITQAISYGVVSATISNLIHCDPPEFERPTDAPKLNS